MADLSYTVDVKGHEDLPKLAAGITAVATALGNGKDIATKLAEFKAAMGGMGGSLDDIKGLDKKIDNLKASINGLADNFKREMLNTRSTIATNVAGISAEFQKIGKAASAGLDEAGAALKVAADKNLKLNVKYATDIETATRQIQEKGTSAMLQSLQTRASNIQRILQSEAKNAVATAQKTYGTDFVAAMQGGLNKQLSVLTNSHQATIRLQRAQHEQMIAEGRKAAAELANIQAQAQVKAATLNPMGNYSSMRSGREFQIKNAQLFMNMPSKADFEAATALAVKDAREAQAKAIMQVRAATNNPVGAFQNYNSKTQTPGKVVGIPTDADVGKVNKLSGAFRQLNIDGNDVHSAMRGLASGFNLLWLTWGKLVPLFAGASISFGLKKTFDIGSEVEYQIKFMETLGQTTKEQGKIIRQALRDIDQTTQFSLVELSQAMVRLGQAGQSPAEALATLKPAADLASVGMTDLKVATDLLIQTQALFGKSATDSGKIAAQIFVATKSSVLDVQDIAGSMKMASEANTRFGKSLEETLAILGALAQAGLKGSAGGTAYINFLRDINGRSGPATKALADLGKATGKTIEAFDSLGKQRSAVDIFNDIAAAADKLSAKDADKILSRIFSDRGGRTFFAMVREGTIDLQKMVDVLKDVKPEELLKGAQGLMDTTKGALNILQGAMVGALDKVFEVNSDKFKAFIVDITKAIDSPAFLLSVQSMVAGALSLYETIKSLLPVIEALGTAWLVFKAGSFGVAVFQGLAQALGGMVPMLATTNAQLLNNTKALFTNTGAWQANGIAVVENAAVQRAAAASQAAGAGALSATAVAAAKAGAAATVTTVGMRALTGVIGFMANPIVGVITTLGLLGYAFWSAKKDATAATADTTESILENGRINLAQWDKEIERLRVRNSLMGQTDTYSGAESQIKVAQDSQAKAIADYEKYAKWLEVRTKEGRNIDPKHALVLQQKLNTLKQAEVDINKAQQGIDTARMRDLSAREEKERQAEAKRNANNKPQGSTPLPPSDKPFKGFTQKPRSYDEQTLPNLQKQMDSELSVIKARFDSEKAIQDSEYKNLLVTQGQYQAKVLASTVTYEQESLASIEAHAANYVSAYVEQYAEIKKVRDGFKPDSENWKAEDAKLEALRNKATTDIQANQDKIEKIKLDSNKRQILAAQDLAGETRKLIKADEEYWTKSKLETDKVESMQKVAEQYRNINTSVFSNATALKAEAEAIAESKAQHEGQLENIRKEIELRMDAIAALETQIELEKESATYTGNNAVWQELSKAKGLNAEELAKLKARYSKSLEEGITDGARRGALAYQKEMEAKASAVTDSIAGAIETAIFKSGKEGGKALRDYLQAELIRKPLMAIVKAIIQPISSMIVGGLMGGGGGGGGGAGGILGMGMQGVGLYNGLTSGTGILGTVGGWLGMGGASASSAYAIGAGGLSLGSGAASGIGLSAGGGGLGVSMGGSVLGSGAAAGASTGIMGALGSIPGWGWAAMAALALLPSLFGRTLKDSGIEGTFGGDKGFEGRSYKFYEGGLFRSDKTEYDALDEKVRKGLADTFIGMRQQVSDFADALGLSTDRLKDYVGSIKVSTFGLSDAEAQKKFEEALATANNELAQQVIGTWETTAREVQRRIQSTNIEMEGGADQYRTETVTENTSTYTPSQFAREGERAIDTLERLATSIVTANTWFKRLGLTLYETSEAGAAAASDRIDAAGGKEAFAANAASYYSNFYTSNQRRIAQAREVQDVFDELGIEMPRTAAGFRRIVEEQRALGPAGDKASAALMGVSGAFAEVYGSIGDLEQAMGISAQSIKGILDDVRKGAATPAEAGKRLEDSIYEGLGSAMTQGLSQMIMSAVVGPLVDGLLTGATGSATAMAAGGVAGGTGAAAGGAAAGGAVAAGGAAAGSAMAQGGAMAGAAVAATIEQARAFMAGFAAIMNDPGVRDTIRDIANGFSTIAGDLAGATGGFQSASTAMATTTSSAGSMGDSITSLGDSIEAEVKRLRGLMTGDSPQKGRDALLAEFTTATAQARAGDQSALEKLPGLSQSLEEATRLSAGSSVELARMRGWLAGSLVETQSKFAVQTDAQWRAARANMTSPDYDIRDTPRYRSSYDANPVYTPWEEATIDSRYANSWSTTPIAGTGRLRGQDPNYTPDIRYTGGGIGAAQYDARDPRYVEDWRYANSWDATPTLRNPRPSWYGPAYAQGTPYVPEDGLAMLHKGEMVIPAAYNPAGRSASAGGQNDEVVQELRALRAEVVELRTQQKGETLDQQRINLRTAKILERWEQGGMPTPRQDGVIA